VTPPSRLRALVAFVVRNWPLKLAAVVLATLLYVGLIASQDSNSFPGPVAVTPINQPAGTVLIRQLRSVEQIKYNAPADLGILTAEDFRATVDLMGVAPTGAAVSVSVRVEPVDPRVTIIDIRPRTIQVVLDESVSASVPVHVTRGTAPPGVQVGDTVIIPANVVVMGPSTAVKRVVEVDVSVTLDPSGLDYDREVQGTPVDAAGVAVTGVEVVPRTIHVTIPLFTNKQSRTLPVNPVLTGAPAPGFKVIGVEVTPLTISVEGDADQLAKLQVADTAPVAVFGATRDLTSVVTLAMPPGVVPLGVSTVSVTVHIAAITETRSFIAGFRIDGADPGLSYEMPATTALLTLFGSSADLDRVAAAPLVVSLDVSGLGVGSHRVTVAPSLPSGITVVSISPRDVTVVITVLGPTPAPSGASPSPSPIPSPSP
jgi:YbbR domain-containing protein